MKKFLFYISIGIGLFSVPMVFASPLDFVTNGLSNGKHFKVLKWEDKGFTPDFNMEYKPQGLTFISKDLLFSYHMKNKGSKVFLISTDNMNVKGSFNMPYDALHTSGLAWDGSFLWAVDYLSNKVYKIDVDSSLTSNKAKVISSFSTGLKGSSACTYLKLRGDGYIVISDFMNTGRIYFMNINKSLKKKRPIYDFSFIGAGFSQGLTTDGVYLYDSNGNIGVDKIYKIDIEKAILKGSYKYGIVSEFNAPNAMVEDLAYDGKYIWTSDESTFKFYRANLEF